MLVEELKRNDIIGWLRNEPNKPWAFSINYERHGEEKTMFPDFMIFGKKGTAVVCDILEPIVSVRRTVWPKQRDSLTSQ